MRDVDCGQTLPAAEEGSTLTSTENMSKRAYVNRLYPVDKTRVNEFGISYDDEDSKKNK